MKGAAASTDLRPSKEDIGCALPVRMIGHHHLVIARVREHAGHHRLRRTVIGIRVMKRESHSFMRIRDVAPRLKIRKRMALKVCTAACASERRLVAEVAVHGHSADPGTLRDVAHRRPGGTERLVQRDRRVNNAAPSLGLAFSPALEAVGAGHRDNHDT